MSKQTTLCYIEKGGCYLMLHRIKKEQAENYSTFIDALNKAENALSKTTRTDIPYHIFVDELEAYCGNEDVFKRDLYFIRDLLFTVKKFNQYFLSSINITKIQVFKCSIIFIFMLF